jgi:DNA-binding transcriptional ArsR family regulator
MSLLPSKPEFVSDAGPRVVGVDSEDADALMSALSSETARRLLSELHAEPAPPAELSNRVDTTLQNTQYHLSNLEDAGAVEVIGTAYSEKGREMDVYAPADQPLVIFAGQEQQASGIRAALSRLLGGIGALLVGSLAIQQTFGDGLGRLVGFGATGGAGGDAGGGDGAAPASTTATEQATDTTLSGGAAGSEGTATGTPPPHAGSTPTATSDGPGIFTTGDATRTATEVARDTATGAASSTPTEVARDTATRAASSTPTAAPTAEPAASTATSTAAPSPTPMSTETVQAAGNGGVDLVASLPPGVLFFLGGLTVLLVGVVVSRRM